MPKRLLFLVTALVLTGASLASAAGHPSYSWHRTPTGSDARLRGLSAINAQTAWTSGSLGTVLRTTDGGSTWASVGPPGTEALQYRDIEAFDATHAVILSIGNGTDSRVYVTSDGGASWTLGFQNDDPLAFYDCMTFFDKKNGLAVSDPVGGAFRLIATDDGGLSWHVVPADIPPALDGEAGFAASGQCLVHKGPNDVWLASGGGATARVYHSSDRGLHWTVADTPIPSSGSAGIFALAFTDTMHGIAVGGDFLAPTASPNSVALTDDGGATWHLAPQQIGEYRSSVFFVRPKRAIAVGPSGSDVSYDGGQTWQPINDNSFDTVDCGHGACWASGEQGRVARLVSKR
jgi:photosystem II stability/assembly factor-like uncharacterized protein